MSHHRLLIAHPRNHIAAPCVAFRATSVLSASILAGVEPLPASPLHLTVLPPCTQLATLGLIASNECWLRSGWTKCAAFVLAY